MKIFLKNMYLDPTLDIPRRSFLFRLTGRERTNSGWPCQGVRRKVHEDVNPEVDSKTRCVRENDIREDQWNQRENNKIWKRTSSQREEQDLRVNHKICRKWYIRKNKIYKESYSQNDEKIVFIENLNIIVVW